MRTRNAIYCAIAARHYNKMTINRSIAERERSTEGERKRARASHMHSINNSLFARARARVYISTDIVITGQIVERKYTPIIHSIETLQRTFGRPAIIRSTGEINYSARAEESLSHAKPFVKYTTSGAA